MKRKFKEEVDEETTAKSKEKERKRQSRWGPQAVKVEPVVAFPQQTAFVAGPSSSAPNSVLSRSSVLSRITSADPQILSYAVRVFGTTDLSEEQWKQCLDQVKVLFLNYLFHIHISDYYFYFFFRCNTCTKKCFVKSRKRNV